MVSVGCNMVGVASLYALALLTNLPVCITVYLLRTGAMQASYPLQRAVLMDAVPAETRGRWNALESVTAFTWTGSAMLGGVLLTHFTFAQVFTITATMYAVATCILSLLIPLTLPAAKKGGTGGG